MTETAHFYRRHLRMSTALDDYAADQIRARADGALPKADIADLTTDERNQLVRIVRHGITAEPRWAWSLREDGTSGWVNFNA